MRYDMLGVKDAVDPRNEYRGPLAGYGLQVKNRWPTVFLDYCLGLSSLKGYKTKNQ